MTITLKEKVVLLYIGRVLYLMTTHLLCLFQEKTLLKGCDNMAHMFVESLMNNNNIKQHTKDSSNGLSFYYATL